MHAGPDMCTNSAPRAGARYLFVKNHCPFTVTLAIAGVDANSAHSRETYVDQFAGNCTVISIHRVGNNARIWGMVGRNANGQKACSGYCPINAEALVTFGINNGVDSYVSKRTAHATIVWASIPMQDT
jgi:hypothetical protein